MAAYCAAEIARVNRQICLLRNVNWWYTGPLVLGNCVFFFGLLFSEPMPLHVSLPISILLCVPMLILGWTVYRINQRTVFQDLMPFRDELSAIHASLVHDAEETKEATPESLEMCSAWRSRNGGRRWY